jgi:hypothetical protein
VGFKNIIKRGIKFFIPYGIIAIRRRIMTNKPEAIRNYFLNLEYSQQNAEIQEIINYFRSNDFSIFPYFFTKKYRSHNAQVLYDDECNMYYVPHNAKKLYFPEQWSRGRVLDYYISLCLEQDIDSPHRYETAEYYVKDGEIIADIGTAEGIWALNYVEQAGKIYLFECENEWIEALKKTFDPWKNKVEIINKYISNKTEGDKITFDDFIKNNEINFIKVDIEGAEIQLLEGAPKTLSRNNHVKLLVCAYHKQDDETNIKSILEKHGFLIENTKRYMLFAAYGSKLKAPYVRRGLIRAKK